MPAGRITRRSLFALPVALWASARVAAAQETDEREALFRALKAAATEREARRVEEEIWRYWMAAGPTDSVRERIAEAMTARGSFELDRALGILDGVVAEAPAYAEGWNQRAFVLFLMERPDAALEDLDRAIEREPKHFAAMAGRGMILMRQGRVELGQKALREALEINPWLRERSMIIPDPEDPPPETDETDGKDI